jgi:hypothetical protein
MYLHLGNVEKYCEILVELGQWERAIAAAPAVSVPFWAALSKRYAEHLAAQDKLDAVWHKRAPVAACWGWQG